MFGIGNKDDQGRQTRIEHRGKHVRASRTGGVSLRAQAEAAGMNFTVNSSHGTRVSRRVAKGTNVAFQRGRFRLRGRYGKGPVKLNLSKSGASLSTRNKIGTFNLTNPNRSSAKIMGVQMRGKKAAQIQTAYMLIAGVFSIIRFAFVLLVNTLIFAVYAAEWLRRLIVAAGHIVANATVALYTSIGDYRTRRRHQRLLSNQPVHELIETSDPDKAEAVIVLMITLQGRGHNSLHTDDNEKIRRAYAERESIRAQPPAADRLDSLAEEIDHRLGEVCPTRSRPSPGSSSRGRRQKCEDALFMQAVRLVAGARDSQYLIALLFLLDDLSMYLGERTNRQEQFLDMYCEQAGISVEPEQ